MTIYNGHHNLQRNLLAITKNGTLKITPCSAKKGIYHNVLQRNLLAIIQNGTLIAPQCSAKKDLILQALLPKKTASSGDGGNNFKKLQCKQISKGFSESHDMSTWFGMNG